ncbi:hypothetical protein PR202_gb11893 [Eleusine coracana subsp. coracana]|uniref:Uncharacterized protein n=1 Tax=Eleusine coracana subsp. coracana TaxID=191504 RepID=A0AAV5ENR3_ELECO|nr:hypothetical protein PR202_gb11893 [Eleusine coracana subsp. coracana]
MDSSALSSSQDYLLLLFPATSTFLSQILAVLLVAASLVWFFPGGPAWAVSRIVVTCRRGAAPSSQAPGIPGVVTTAISGPSAHRAIAALSRSLPGGDALLCFTAGLTRFAVASRPDTAREVLSGPAFADRPVKDAARGLLFHRAMGFAPSGGYWRALRP